MTWIRTLSAIVTLVLFGLWMCLYGSYQLLKVTWRLVQAEARRA